MNQAFQPQCFPSPRLIPGVALILALTLSGCALTGGPGGSSGVQRPEPVVSLAGAKRAAAYNRSHGGLALIVQHKGGVILEEYTNGGSRGKPVHIRSITKNLWAMLILMAEEDGFLDLDEPAAATITEWSADPRKRRITLRQLLNQTAGLEPGFNVIYGGGTRDKYRAAVNLRTRSEPGAAFKYGPGHYEALGEILKRKLKPRGLTPMGYMQGRLLNPLGIAAGGWRSDRAGNYYFSAGADFTARGLLEFGRMIEQRGFSHGRQHLGAARLAQATKGTAANPAYGLSLWLNMNRDDPAALEVDVERILESGGNFAAWDRACASTLAPADTVILVGSSGQRIYVMPSLDLVVVRQGAGPSMRDPEFLRLLLSEP